MIRFAALFVNLIFLLLPFALAALMYLPFERRILRSLDFVAQVSENDRHFWMESHRRYAERQGRVGGWLAAAMFIAAWLMVGFVYTNWHAIGREISELRDL